MTRHLWVLVRHWVGLTVAAFLCVSGITGAVISWDHELDDLPNPHLTHVESRGAVHFCLTLPARRRTKQTT